MDDTKLAITPTMGKTTGPNGRDDDRHRRRVLRGDPRTADRRDNDRVRGMETKSSACPLDCPDLCGLTVTVENGRVIAVEGDHRSSFTNGLICGKVRKITEHLYGPDRVLHPMIRKGPKGSGAWEQLTLGRRARRDHREAREDPRAPRRPGDPAIPLRWLERLAHRRCPRGAVLAPHGHSKRQDVLLAAATQRHTASTARCQASRSRTTSTPS